MKRRVEEKHIHIDVLFGQVRPEYLDRCICSPDLEKERKGNPLAVDSGHISQACYLRCARGLKQAPRRTDDELLQRYRSLESWLAKKPRGGVFSLLAEYANEVLVLRGEPRCRQEHILDWRERTLPLGQDLFTCAGLAAKDVRENCESACFTWLPCVRTDHVGLRQLLERGVSDNHYHLNGSTQIFSLTWGFLMNYPGQAKRYFDRAMFREDLKGSLSFGEGDDRRPWRESIYDAAWIRAYLFDCIQNGVEQARLPRDGEMGSFRKFRRSAFDRRGPVIRKVNNLRREGARLKQANGAWCLDYAITREVAEHNPGEYRFLAGERSFLYRCFRRCFDGSFEQREQDLLYLYLQLKHRFRQELIQTNGRPGFHNFSSYQDRKSLCWGERGEYWAEARRMAVAGPLAKNDWNPTDIRSLELRVTPVDSQKQLIRGIWDDDQMVEQAMALPAGAKGFPGNAKKQRMDRARKQDRYFYVLHFIKEPLPPLGEQNCFLPRARGSSVRARTKRQAKALARGLERSGYLCERIRGIDASSSEIGCRPENFAVAFRYLRGLCPTAPCVRWRPRAWPRLGFTYHVGEDFLDLADGLRAIDEAVCYFNLERGDRLGHALALGIAPEQYYRVKEGCVYLPAQDLLDNLTWLLYRSVEWGVPMPTELHSALTQRAEALLKEIYGTEYREHDFRYEITLDKYYQSWKFRGDAPEIFWKAFYAPEKMPSWLQWLRAGGTIDDPWLQAQLDERLWDYEDNGQPSEMSQWLTPTARPRDRRCERVLQLLLYHYHYGRNERLYGQEVESFLISDQYIALIRAMQDCLMGKIRSKDIAIECNPSSNKLIGTFDRYENHPIFRFNRHGLLLPEHQKAPTGLRVCVNTDDQGIFDTSLENEYGLLYGCLQGRRSADSDWELDDDAILDYLDRLRRAGNTVVFPKADQALQKRAHKNGGAR